MDAAVLVFALPIMLMLVLSMVSGVVMIVGGLKMLRLQSYGWAMTACVLAVLPFNPVGFIGLIIGIWGLVVLNQPGVRAAFRGQSHGPAGAATRSLGWLMGLAIMCLVLILLIALGAVAAWWLVPM